MSDFELYIDNSAFDALPSPFSRDVVEGCADEDQLADWFITFLDKIDELKEFASAFALAGSNAERFAGRLAYCKIALRWIEERMRELGYDVPYPASDPRKLELMKKDRRIQALKAQVRALGGDPEQALAA